MYVMMIEHLFNMTMDFQWLKHRSLKQEKIAMFFQENANKSFTKRFQVRKNGHLLLDMIQEEGQ